MNYFSKKTDIHNQRPFFVYKMKILKKWQIPLISPQLLIILKSHTKNEYHTLIPQDFFLNIASVIQNRKRKGSIPPLPPATSQGVRTRLTRPLWLESPHHPYPPASQQGGVREQTYWTQNTSRTTSKVYAPTPLKPPTQQTNTTKKPSNQGAQDHFPI